MDGNITIDITQLGGLVANSIPTNANVKVDDTAVDAIWTRDVSYDDLTGIYTLTLTSTEVLPLVERWSP